MKRNSTRMYKKQQVSQTKRHEDLQSKSSISSKGSKTPEIVKSLSYTKENKLETLHSLKKLSHTIIKNHDHSNNIENKTSSKMTFWGVDRLISRC
jgi:hypothetical protein